MVPPLPSVPSVARKRRASVEPPSVAKRPTKDPTPKAVPKRPSRPPTAAMIEKEAAAKRRNEAPQSAIAFDARDKYPVKMKLLLTEAIYLTPSCVSFLPYRFVDRSYL
jgi:hypothetical protein